MTPSSVDWAELRASAAGAAERAYAPYSHYRVGAAGLVDDGRVLVGCNVENASYGLTLCAECGLVSALHVEGRRGQLVAVAVCGPDGDYVSSCGRCRQLLLEAGGASLVVNERAIGDWLPDAFDLNDLDTPGPDGH